MRVSHWILKITNTQSEYVRLTAFPLQKWLHGRTSLLRLYVQCLYYNGDGVCLLRGTSLTCKYNTGYSFPCHYHSTKAPYPPSFTCYSYQKDKRATPGKFPNSNALLEIGGTVKQKRAVTCHAVSRQPVTAEATVRSQISPRESCGRQNGTVTGFSRGILFFPCLISLRESFIHI